MKFLANCKCTVCDKQTEEAGRCARHRGGNDGHIADKIHACCMERLLGRLHQAVVFGTAMHGGFDGTSLEPASTTRTQTMGEEIDLVFKK